MIDGDVALADAVTYKRHLETQEDGSVIVKEVLVSMDSPTPTSSANPLQSRANPTQFDGAVENYNQEDIHNLPPPQTPPPRKSRVSVINV